MTQMTTFFGPCTSAKYRQHTFVVSTWILQKWAANDHLSISLIRTTVYCTSSTSTRNLVQNAV